MEDVSEGSGIMVVLDTGLPETLEEAEARAASIERAVHEQTGRRVRNLSVEVDKNVILLRGRCASYHCKQLAQTAAMPMVHGERLINAIEVW